MSKKRRNDDSAIKTVFLILVAAVVMVTAIYVVVTIFGKIQSDYKKLEAITEEETSTEAIEIEKKETEGWNETDEGWKYLIDKETGKYAVSQWLEVEGFLYYFDDKGIMMTGQWEHEGQMYTFHDTKGYLKDIQVDLSYVPDNMGENLDSLVRTNAFWCYLDDEEEGIFKTILYRRTVENKVLPLGDVDAPERTTRNSMRAEGDYVYYLPKVKESSTALLTEAEKELCDTLVRMIPGQKTKEIIAEDVGGYFFLNGIIYYSQNGKIYSATSGTEMPVGGEQYSVIIKDDSCYLVDAIGNPPSASTGGSITMGDRIYRFDEDGKITAVKHGQPVANGVTYYLSGSGTKSAVCSKTASGDKTVIHENYGVQSYCIVDNSIFYSAYVDKATSGEWYSQIFKAGLDGSQKTAVSQRFLGTVETMYYFEEEGEIYGEYHPAPWKQAYGSVVVIKRDGTILKLHDGEARTGKYVAGNDMLELVMAKDGEVYCLWHDCEWSQSRGITSVLWSKAVKLSASNKTSIEFASEEKEEETDAVIKPIGSDVDPVTEGTNREETSAATGTVAPISPIEPAPTTAVPSAPSSTVPAPTIPAPNTPVPSTLAPTVPVPTTRPLDEVEIIPIG